jgi:ligand-binding sensor protein
MGGFASFILCGWISRKNSNPISIERTENTPVHQKKEVIQWYKSASEISGTRLTDNERTCENIRNCWKGLQYCRSRDRILK